jgi:hypothetical protein
MTILENDLDENEIEELVKEKEAESRIEIMIDDEEPVEKAIPTPQDSMFGSPTPPALNSSPNTLSMNPVPPDTLSNLSSPTDTLPSNRPYSRRPTEQQVAAAERTTRAGRVTKPSNKALGKAFVTKDKPDQSRKRPWTECVEYYAFASAETRRSRQDLAPPPEHWQNLSGHPDEFEFKQAAQVEIKEIEGKGTYELIKPTSVPSGKQILPVRWVFTHKLDTAGYLQRFKGRLCVRGDLQDITGVDVYAATGAYRSLRILLALVAAFDLICDSADVKNAFLNAILSPDEIVYVRCPPGFETPGHVWKLKRALYGLRSAPKAWFKELSQFLALKGFKPCPDEPCIMLNDSGLIIFFYVDDFLFIGPRSRADDLASLKRSLHEKYGIKDLGPATSFLNIKITRDESTKRLWVSQRPYIDKLISKFHLEAMLQHPIRTPLSPNYHATPHEGQATENERREYQCKTGSILYAAIVSRPDIAFAASLLCQYNANPSREHLREADRVLGYLAHTRNYAIEYSLSEDGKRQFVAASDASFADDYATRRSSQGYVLMLFNGPILWQSVRQKTVTTSTTEAELLALSATARETIAMCRLFFQMKFSPGSEPPTVECDNKQTVGLIIKERPQLTTKLRHVDIHHFWLRQSHRDKIVEIEWTPTNDMIADGMTKALMGQRHDRFVEQLGIVKESFTGLRNGRTVETAESKTD